MNRICNICEEFEAVNEIPEINQYYCGLCQLRKRVPFENNDRHVYYPPKYLKKIDVFDDGNQKYQNEPNEWLQIGHRIIHPEKIMLVNRVTNHLIDSISVWKTSIL